MGMGLVNRHNDYIGFSHMVWARILYLAEDYGWQPAGTVSPYDHDDPNSEYYSPEPWHGGYASNESQMVSVDDACAFADALEKACNLYQTSAYSPETTSKLKIYHKLLMTQL